MPIPGQPPPSSALRRSLELLRLRKPDEAERAARHAAIIVKAKHGSGSHPLACAYADMARLHYKLGEYKKAASEFRHACDSPMPKDTAGRRDRLAFMFGFGACLEAMDNHAGAEKVYSQCVAFATNLHGAGTPDAAAAVEPLASAFLRSGKVAEAVRLLNDAYDILWKDGDPRIARVIPARAEALKAAGRTDNPFADLDNLPDEVVAETVATAAERTATGDPVRVRQVLAELLRLVDKRYGDGHAMTADALAAVAHHETGLGEKADPKVRTSATRRAVWSFAVRRVPDGLLENLEVGFESGGAIHLVPHLARDAGAAELAQVEAVLTQAVDDLYTRPAKKMA